MLHKHNLQSYLKAATIASQSFRGTSVAQRNYRVTKLARGLYAGFFLVCFVSFYLAHYRENIQSYTHGKLKTLILL